MRKVGFRLFVVLNGDLFMDSKRLGIAFGWGVLATVVMSIPMLIATATGVAPMPEPIPKALVGLVFGETLPLPAHMALAAISHLAYGGVWAGILAASTRPVTIWKGLGLGVFLWLLMQIIVLPLLDWGAFGTAETPAIAVGTLVLHLIYGAVVGWTIDRRHAHNPAPA